MIKIGLTGNYLSGHDEISTLFEKIGVRVFDADLMLRYLINYSQPHISKIKSSFGDYAYNLGVLNIDRFRTKNRLEDLLDICEFDLLLAYAKYRQNHKDDIYTIFKYSFLFERELEYNLDYIINCHRPKYLREKEMKDHTRIPTPSIKSILDGEKSEIDKNISSNFVIRNLDPYFREIKISKNNEIVDQVNKIHQTLSKKNSPKYFGELIS